MSADGLAIVQAILDGVLVAVVVLQGISLRQHRRALEQLHRRQR